MQTKKDVKYIYLNSRSLGGEAAILAIDDQVLLCLDDPQQQEMVYEAARELAIALKTPLLCCQIDDNCFCQSPEDVYPAVQDADFDPYLVLSLADDIGYFCDTDGFLPSSEVVYEAAIWSRDWIEQELVRVGQSPCQRNIELVLKTVHQCIGQEGGAAFMRSLFEEAMHEWKEELVPLPSIPF